MGAVCLTHIATRCASTAFMTPIAGIRSMHAVRNAMGAKRSGTGAGDADIRSPLRCTNAVATWHQECAQGAVQLQNCKLQGLRF